MYQNLQAMLETIKGAESDLARIQHELKGIQLRMSGERHELCCIVRNSLNECCEALADLAYLMNPKSV